jgi:hypothetical protein
MLSFASVLFFSNFEPEPVAGGVRAQLHTLGSNGLLIPVTPASFYIASIKKMVSRIDADPDLQIDQDLRALLGTPLENFLST